MPSRAANWPGRVYCGASCLCGNVIAEGRFGCGGRLSATTDAIATVKNARSDTLVAIGRMEGGVESLVAHGRLAGYRACCGEVKEVEGGLMLDEGSATALGVKPGDTISHVGR